MQLRNKPNPAVKFAPLRCAGTALKRSPLPSRYASLNREVIREGRC
jgi:hypothetical protein